MTAMVVATVETLPTLSFDQILKLCVPSVAGESVCVMAEAVVLQACQAASPIAGWVDSLTRTKGVSAQLLAVKVMVVELVKEADESVMAGAAGGVESTVKAVESVVLTLPATSVATMRIFAVVVLLDGTVQE